MARCQHLPMGLRPGTPPTPTPGGGLSCPFVVKRILLGGGVGASIEVPSPDPRFWFQTHLWGPARKEMDRAGPWREHRIGNIKTPQFPTSPPHCSHVGDSISKGATPPSSLSIPAFPALGGEGRAAEIFIYFLYLFNFFFFFGVESDRWRRVPGEPALPQCRRMPITVSHVIAAARDVPSPYGLA